MAALLRCLPVLLRPLAVLVLAVSLHTSAASQRASAADAPAVPERQASDPAAPASIDITNPSGPQAFGEAADYATLAWNNPWDMLQPLDVRQPDAPMCPGGANTFTPVQSCPEGLWCGLATQHDAYLFLQHPGYADALFTGQVGNLRPINANVYRRLTFRMYVGSVSPDDLGFQVQWTNGTVSDFANPARWGQSRWYPIYPGWNIYSIDLTYDNDNTLLGNLKWEGSLTGLRLDPGTQLAGKEVRLDWVRLSPPTSRTVQWNSNENGNVTFRLQQAGNPTSDPVRLYWGHAHDQWWPQEVSASAGSFDLPVSLPPGNWSVFVQTSSSSDGPAGPWQVQAAPTLSFVAPSFLSGEDYALTHLGNAWDMNDPDDIDTLPQMTPNYHDGVMTATSAGVGGNTNFCGAPTGDPNLYFLDYVNGSDGDPADPPIDTNKYRYFSFRLMLDGTPDVSHGWVARIAWMNEGFTQCGLSNDIPLHAGWNEVTVDLAGNVVDNANGGCSSPWRATPFRAQIRLDPHEVPEPTTFHLDYAYLTAIDQAKAGASYAIQYFTNQPNAAINFFYDTDTNPNNGRTPVRRGLAQAAFVAGNQFRLFLPFVLRAGAGSSIPGPGGALTTWWNLAGVAPGTYYLSAEIDNGYVKTNWYSEAPVVVTP